MMYGRISVKSSRTKGHSVTLRIRRDKKRGHNHKMIETVNLKQQVVMRCEICKHHYLFLCYNFRTFVLILGHKLNAYIMGVLL